MQNPYLKPPEVNYPTGDYRKISRLDRGRAEMTKNERLASELEREKMWKDTEFQRRLQELQKSLFSPGGVGGSTGSSVQFAPQDGQIGRMSGGTAADRMLENNPELSAYMQRLRGAKMITGPNANPYALGYNFGTLSGKGGYFGKAAPVPDTPGSIGLDEKSLYEILKRLGAFQRS